MMSGQFWLRSFGVMLVVACLCVTEAIAGIAASGNASNPSTTTQYTGNEANGFAITEDVAWDPSAGPWIKRLINDPNSAGGGGGFPILSGQRVNITEILTNTGSVSWTDWHEEILTDTLINGNTQRGFLFDKNSNMLTLMADYGGGFQGLSEGVDYTVMGMDPTGPGSGSNNGWEAIWIVFLPHAVIQTGDTLKIEKKIFEVFNDQNVWEPSEFVEIAQYPTVPEPSSFLLAVGLGFVSRRRRKRT